ncbi:MAG: BON domain-containing protein [Alphaproteobacteria bacterium]|nr:BON domain-containing protein [Alphaproteobacteria bacterium]
MTLLRIALLLTCLSAAGCAAVQPERSAGRQLDDFNASLAIKSAMLRADGYVLERIDVEVTEGVALLTGSAPRAEDRVYAECVAWSAPSVRSVNNTIAIGAGRNAGAVARDAWITQQVRARLASDLSVRSVNYNVETYSGAVHLLGFARSAAERDRAAAHAAEVSGVVRVIDLVRIAGETPDLPARGARQAAACDLSGGETGDDAAPLDTLMDETSPELSPES